MEDDRPVGQGLSVYRHGNAQSKGQGDENTLIRRRNPFAIKVFKTERESMIMRITTLIPIAFAILLISISNVSAVTSKYAFTGYTSVPYNANSDRGVAFNYSDSCQVALESTNTFTAASPFTSVLLYYPYLSASPITSTLTGVQNTDCRSWGETVMATATRNATNGLYENGITYSQSASSGFVTTKTKYLCDVSGTDYYANFSIFQSGDSANNCLWRSRKEVAIGAFRHTTWNNLLVSEYNICGDLSDWIKTTCNTDGSGSAGYSMTNQYIYPFNSSGGIVQYSFSPPNVVVTVAMSCSGQYWIDLLDVESGTITNYKYDTYTCSGAGTIPRTFFSSASQSGTLPLPKDKEYLWIVTWEINLGGAGSAWTATSIQPNLNMSIYTYHPDFVCGAYSDCINGNQWRNCVDANHIAGDEIQTQSCFEFPTQQTYLGFDTFDTVNVWYCSQGSLIPSNCPRLPILRQRKVPSDWTRGGYYATDTLSSLTGWIEDYVDVSESVYYPPDSGSIETSLKMWYLPRKTFLPVFVENYTGSGYDRVICNETTLGQMGTVYRDDINSSFWVARNITAISPYMTLSYRVRNCDSVETQTTGGFACWEACLLTGTCTQAGVCNSTGIDQYSWNGCPEVPKSTIGVRLRDISSGSYPVYYSQAVSTDTFNLGYYEDAINNMNLSHIYELTFAVPPNGGVEDQNAYCVYVDDVNINFRNEPVSCTASGCDPTQDYNNDGVKDYTYITATPRTADSCNIQVSEFDPRCVPAGLVADAQALKDCTKNYTCDGSTLVVKDCVTDTYSYTINNSYCTSQSHLVDSTQPMTGDVIISSVASMFTIPAVIALLMSILISAIITGKVSTMFGQQTLSGGHGAGVIFVMSFISILTAFTVAGLFPLWLYIVLAVIAGAISAKLLGIIGGE